MSHLDVFGTPQADYEVAGTVVSHDDKYLLVQERQKKAYGLWNLPAGRVDEGESLEDAAARETQEESGFSVKIIKHLNSQLAGSRRPMLHAYEAEITGGQLQHQEDELLDARFFSLEQIEKLNSENALRHKWVIESIYASRKK